MKEFIIKNRKKIELIGIILYLFAFIIIAMYIGKHHEPWADEAQAWLIAKDNDICGIFKAIRYEGTPAIWHLILKLFIALGITEKYLYLIPILFTSIGVILLLINKKIPIYIRFLLPLTYYIFFQYTIIARSYCLIFPLLMAIALIWDNRKKYLWVYSILLILLMNISAHTLLIAGALWFGEAIDIFKNYLAEKDNTIERKMIIFLSVIMIMLSITIVYSFPSGDCLFSTRTKFNLLELISRTMLLSSNNIILNLIQTIIIIYFLWIPIYSENDPWNVLKNVGLLLPNILLDCLIHCSEWHIGIFTLLILFYFIINNLIDKKKIKLFLIIVIIIQIRYSYISAKYDIYNDYASGKNAYEYLNTIDDINNKKIYAGDFHTVDINFYSDKNIFKNFDNSYYNWKKQINIFDYIEDGDILIISDYRNKLNIVKLESLEKIGFKVKHIESYMIVKNEIYEPTGYYILEKQGEI